MPINVNEYNPKPKAEDWDWAWDKIINEMQTNYIEAYEAETRKKSDNQKINSANNIKTLWMNYLIDNFKNSQHPMFKTEGARWLVEQLYVDEPDYPYKDKQPTLDGTENMTIQLRRQHVATLKSLKEQNPFG